MKKKQSEIYEVTLRMDKIMRTPEQEKVRIDEIDRLISHAKRLEVNEDALQALEDSKQDKENHDLPADKMQELRYLIKDSGLRDCGLAEYPGGIYAKNVLNPTDSYKDMKGKFEYLFFYFNHIAKFSGVVDVRGENAEDSFVLEIKDSEITLLEGRGVREED